MEFLGKICYTYRYGAANKGKKDKRHSQARFSGSYENKRRKEND